MTATTEQTKLNIADYIDKKCHDCFGCDLVRQRVSYEGKWRSANLMCTCIEATVKKMAKSDSTMQVKDLLRRILEEFKKQEAQKEN